MAVSFDGFRHVRAACVPTPAYHIPSELRLLAGGLASRLHADNPPMYQPWGKCKSWGSLGSFGGTWGKLSRQNFM